MTVGLLAVSVLLIAVNGFFVAAEFALLASRVTRLEPMAEGGDDAGASAALEAVQDLHRSSSALSLESPWRLWVLAMWPSL